MSFTRIAVCALRYLLLGQHDEEGSLAYLGQAYDAGFHDFAIRIQPSAHTMSLGEGFSFE
jgi:hypothetical protein